MSTVVQRVLVGAAVGAAAMAFLGSTAHADTEPLHTTGSSVLIRDERLGEIEDVYPLCAVITGQGLWCDEHSTPVRDTDGNQLNWGRTEHSKFVLVDSAGNLVRDADGLTIRVDRLGDNKLRHADRTPVLNEQGKNLDLSQQVDLGKLRASSVASEDATMKRIDPEFTNTVVAKDAKGHEVSVGKLSYNVRIDGKPLFDNLGWPIKLWNNVLVRGMDEVKYPDGREVNVTESVDVEALLKSPDVALEPDPEWSRPIVTFELPVQEQTRSQPVAAQEVPREIVEEHIYIAPPKAQIIEQKVSGREIVKKEMASVRAWVPHGPQAN